MCLKARCLGSDLDQGGIELSPPWPPGNFRSMPAKTPQPITLTGRHVRLEPLVMKNLGDLFETGGRDDEVWR